MAQRRSATGLPGSIAGCLLSRALLQPEKQRTRPAASRNQARHFRKRAILLATEEHAGFEHCYLVLHTAPFAQQDGSRMKLMDTGDLRTPTRAGVVRNSFEQASRGGAQAAKRPFLESVRDSARHQVAARATWRLRPVECLPVLPKLEGRFGAKSGDLT